MENRTSSQTKFFEGVRDRGVIPKRTSLEGHRPGPDPERLLGAERLAIGGQGRCGVTVCSEAAVFDLVGKMSSGHPWWLQTHPTGEQTACDSSGTFRDSGLCQTSRLRTMPAVEGKTLTQS